MLLKWAQREIKHEVELRQFVKLEELVHLATKVDRQLKVSSGRRYPPSPKIAEKITEAKMNHPKQEGDKPTARNTALVIQVRNEGSTGSIQCLGRGHKANQCPNKKNLVLQDGEYFYEEEYEEKPMGNEFGSDSDSEDDDVDEHIKAEKSPPGKLLGVNIKAF
ncbi:unnamed protein product [Linum trigynum]|uniref:Uncharacterized protein n=1 Tax=Linum trigynum TaxID=586398 RepID=A0AAV2F6L6_9ROSI